MPVLLLNGAPLILGGAPVVLGGLTAPFMLVSYPSSAYAGRTIGVLGSYIGSAPSRPTATWTSGDVATVSSWSASGGAWSCLITTPATATGTFVFNIGGVVSNPVVITTAAALSISLGLTNANSVAAGA